MTNRLANETSPYLLQHAGNPVDWFPWGPDAMELARAEDRPILLSIGYAACHWCHVMAHESFEDPETAAMMNDLFVNIKVDREERPDIDAIYMQAVQAMTGQGGWPLTAFLTPDGVPFYMGTYFPKENRYGMPSFRRVLRAAADAYRNRRAEVERTGAAVREMFAAAAAPARATNSLTRELLDRAAAAIAGGYDARHGGFGGAPKFPSTMVLEFLLARWARTGTDAWLDMAARSFHMMAAGGIHDQIGGGFARYSVDAQWLVPHFEKMLYDNALLARLGVHLWQATGDAGIRRVSEDTIDWAVREMLADTGGFCSSLDADSEGHEGKFYVWSVEEFGSLLGKDAELCADFWGVTPAGNFEGSNILHVPHELTAVAARHGVTPDHAAAIIASARRRLFEAREKRMRPGRDDKVLASWNGLMVRACAEAARAFGRDDYGAVAERAGDFLFRELVHDGRALRSYNRGSARINGFLEDHAALGLGALSLYELTFDAMWLERARELSTSTIARFWDDALETFHDTPHDGEQLIAQPRDVTDNATPAGTSLACELLARLAELDGDADLARRATSIAESLAEPMARYPMAFGHMLLVTDMLVHGAVELAIVGDPTARDFGALAGAAARAYVPSLVLAGGPPDDDAGMAILRDRPLQNGRSTAYICRHYACLAPVTDADSLRERLAEALRA